MFNKIVELFIDFNFKTSMACVILTVFFFNELRLHNIKIGEKILNDYFKQQYSQ